MTVNVPALPTVKVVLSALVMVGAVGASIVKVNVWMVGSKPLSAVIVRVYVPSSPEIGVPLKVAVPSPLSTKVTLPGNEGALVAVMVDTVGTPLVVTVNVPKLPTLKAVLSGLVIAGDTFTVNVKDCIASGVMPLLAVTVIE